jgi:hypothetical protein
MTEMKRTLRIFYSDGKVKNMKVANEYHAQNCLPLLFVIGDGDNENYENRVVFAELLGSKIFAYRGKDEIVIRNATDEFLDECKELEGKQT